MTREILTVSAEYTPIDLLLYRHYGREVPGLVERTYDLNQNLAARGEYLPLGTKVVVEIPAPAAAAPVRLLRLTD